MPGGVIDILKYVITADTSGVSSESKKAEKALAGIESAANSLGTALKSIITIALVKQISDFVYDLASAADRAEILQKVMGRVAENVGISHEAIAEANAQLKSLGFTATEAAQAIIKFSTSGLGIDNLKALADVSKNLSVILGVDVDEALDQVTNAVVTGRTAMLKAQGIVVDATTAYDKFAASLGVSRDRLNEAGQQQAIINELLAQSGTFAQIAADNAKSLQVGFFQLDDTLAEMKITLGDLVKEFYLLDYVVETLKIINSLLKIEIAGFRGLIDAFQSVAKGKFKDALEDLEDIGIRAKKIWDKMLKDIGQGPTRTAGAASAVVGAGAAAGQADKYLIPLIDHSEDYWNNLKKIYWQTGRIVRLTDEWETHVYRIDDGLAIITDNAAEIAERWQKVLSIVDAVGSSLSTIGVKQGSLLSDLANIGSNIVSGNIAGVITGGVNLLAGLFGGGPSAQDKFQESQAQLYQSNVALRESIDALTEQYKHATVAEQESTASLIAAALQRYHQAVGAQDRGNERDFFFYLDKLNEILRELGLPAVEGGFDQGTFAELRAAFAQLNLVLSNLNVAQSQQDAFLNPFIAGGPDIFENMFQQLYKLNASGELNADLAKQLLAFWIEYGDLTTEQQSALTDEILRLISASGTLTEEDRRQFLLALKTLQEEMGGGGGGLSQVERNITTITSGQADIIAGLLNSILFEASKIRQAVESLLDRAALSFGAGIVFNAGAITINQNFTGPQNVSQLTVRSITDGVRKTLRAEGYAT